MRDAGATDGGQALRGAPADVRASSACALDRGRFQPSAPADAATKHSGQPSGVEVPARCDGVPAERASVAERESASSGLRDTASSGPRGGSDSSSASHDAEPTDRPPNDFLGAGFAAGSNFSPERDVLLRLVRCAAQRPLYKVHVLHCFQPFWDFLSKQCLRSAVGGPASRADEFVSQQPCYLPPVPGSSYQPLPQCQQPYGLAKFPQSGAQRCYDVHKGTAGGSSMLGTANPVCLVL